MIPPSIKHEGCTVWIKTTNPFDKSGPSLVRIVHVFDDGKSFIYNSFWGKKGYSDITDSKGFSLKIYTACTSEYEVVGIGEECNDYIPMRTSKKVKINPLKIEIKNFFVAIMHSLLRKWDFKI